MLHYITVKMGNHETIKDKLDIQMLLTIKSFKMGHSLRSGTPGTPLRNLDSPAKIQRGSPIGVFLLI